MSDLQATWYVVRASGAWPHEAEYIYTSAEPPVEAVEYERVLAQLAAISGTSYDAAAEAAFEAQNRREELAAMKVCL